MPYRKDTHCQACGVCCGFVDSQASSYRIEVESAIDHNAAQVGIILEPLTMTNDNNLITAYIQV